MSWYAVHTKPQQEAVAHRDLVRGGFSVFYPHQRIRRHVRRAGVMIPKWVMRPYFPRWIFVNESTEGLWRVRRVSAVSGIASNGIEPVRIPDAVMAILMAGADADGLMGSRDEVARKRFAVASKVRFMDDTLLAGIVATVLKDNGRDIVDVLIDVLGGKVVKAKPEMLELVA